MSPDNSNCRARQFGTVVPDNFKYTSDISRHFSKKFHKIPSAHLFVVWLFMSPRVFRTLESCSFVVAHIMTTNSHNDAPRSRFNHHQPWPLTPPTQWWSLLVLDYHIRLFLSTGIGDPGRLLLPRQSGLAPIVLPAPLGFFHFCGDFAFAVLC